MPYPIIANLLLKTKHRVVRRLVEDCAPKRVCSALIEEEENAVGRDEGNGKGKGKDVKEVRGWLERYLKQGYERVEREESACWKVVRGWDVDVAREMIGKLVEEGVLGGERYKVMGDQELKVQMQWRRGRNWKAGSEPCEVKDPEKLDSGAEKSDDEDEDEEVYDRERIKFFEDMVADMVDDAAALETPRLEAENERRKGRKMRCSVGAPPWIEAPVSFYNEKRAARNWLELPTEFQTAYEMYLEEEHQKLLCRLEDTNENIASYKRELDILSKKRTDQASRDLNERNRSSKATINQVTKDSRDRLSSSSIEKKMSKALKIFEENRFSKTKSNTNHATKSFDDSYVPKIENTIRFQHATENLEQKLEDWEDYKNDDGESDSQTSSSKLRKAAEKAFAEWQRNDANQGWLEMSLAGAL